MSDSALIRLSGITKTYGSGQAAFQALKGIDLAIADREVVVEQERGGRAIRREFNRQWVRVEVDRERWTREPRLVLRSGRDALRFGETIPASERMALARRIRGMLGAR